MDATLERASFKVSSTSAAADGSVRAAIKSAEVKFRIVVLRCKQAFLSDSSEPRSSMSCYVTVQHELSRYIKSECLPSKPHAMAGLISSMTL